MFTVILTLLIEIPVLILLRFRKKDILIIAILINIATNASANLLMYRVKTVIDTVGYTAWLFPIETACVFFEFITMSFFTDKKIKLLLTIIIANIISYEIGILIFGRY